MDRFYVSVSIRVIQDGKIFSETTSVSPECDRATMHNIERNIAETLIRMGDEGLALQEGAVPKRGR